MKAAIFNGPGDITVGSRPDPVIQAPTDAIVRVTLACVCGSDLWYYRGDSPFAPGPIGHEFVGVVEDVGADVATVKRGDFVIAPFAFSDGTCAHCRHGIPSACVAGGFYPSNGDGGQGEAVRVPHADGSLVTVPGTGHSDAMLSSLLTLSDVMSTGHHAALSARVGPGKTAVVVGDGAVGLCGVIASKRLGAERVILLGRNPARTALGREFGADEVVEERGEAAVERVRELTGGLGAHSVLECVGPDDAVLTAIGCARDGGAVGRVGIPEGDAIPGVHQSFFANLVLAGGPAPARAYIEELLPDVLEGTIEPGRVFDRTTGLDGVPDGYRAMNYREALKVLVEP
jgi:threonine dehydrogenase-like Zn-dependent dehydrogenase